MKKKFKALVSILLAVVMLMGTIPTVLAEDADLSVDEVVTGEDTGDTVETPDPIPEPEPAPEPEPKEDDIVGEIYLCQGSGHLWVYFINHTDKPLRIGLYDLPPGEGVSIGTFGLTRFDGFGVYYNMETYRNERFGGGDYIRLKDPLTRKEAEDVTATILTANYWDPIFNCTTFACRVWNRASDIPMVPMVIPAFVGLFMLMWGANSSDKMQHQPAENCFKQRGTGKNSYLEHCCKATLNAY